MPAKRKSTSRKKPGQPTKFTEQVRQDILTMTRMGMPASEAAKAAGISERSFYNYKARGERAQALETEMAEMTKAELVEKAREAGVAVSGSKEALIARILGAEQEYLQFFQELTRAGSQRELVLLERIQKASLEDWRAAGWLLSRLIPERYSERKLLQHTGADGGPIQTESVEPPAERVRGRILSIAGRLDEAAAERQQATESA